MFDSNRRKYPRVNYPCQLTVWLENSQNETILATTSNIGVGGVCVHLNQEVQVGTKMDIQLDFFVATTFFRCKGVVVRCMLQADKFYNIGIQFENLSELEISFLKRKISELMSNEQKGKN